jgi:hypothetical protein
MHGLTVVFGNVRYSTIFIKDIRAFSDFYRDLNPSYIGRHGDNFYVEVENFYAVEDSIHPFSSKKINPERLYQLLLKLTETTKP